MSLFNGKKSNGIHPPSNKTTASKKIETAPLPKEVILSFSQHIGAPAKSIVNKGDYVKVGQKIAEAGGFVSVPIHSTVSGKITKIIEIVSSVTSQICKAIIIESDGKDDWISLDKNHNLEDLSREEILNKIREAGIVGLGGATFPTHVKLQPPSDKKIDTIIVNGCECEPFITSDHRLMIEFGKEIIKGLEIMMKVLGCRRVYIAIEKNKPDAIENMNNIISEMNINGDITVEILPTQYPMGAEKTLVKRILGREVPINGLPLDIGVIVQNVGTLKAINDIIYLGKPLVERVVTVSGEIKEPKNITIRFGTPASDVIDYCGGTTSEADVMIFGGPMMGIAQTSFNTPTSKGTNSILLQKNQKKMESNCIRCGTCVENCPMSLMPLMYVAYVKKNMYEDLNDYWIDNCVECGSCSYGCPASIPIVQYIKVGKTELQKRRSK